MPIALIVGIALAVVTTATISGALGMGGGMILMGIYGLLLPVNGAMVLHGATQLASNGFRAILLRQHIRGKVVASYAVGGSLAIAVFAAVALSPDRGVVLCILGLTPFVSFALPKTLRPNILNVRTGIFSGFLVVSLQLLCGVSGPVLDLFYFSGPIAEQPLQIVATKATTQTIGHAAKIVVYGGLLVGGTEIPEILFVIALVGAYVGTRMGRSVLRRLDAQKFQRWASALILLIGVVYSTRGVFLLSS